MTIWNNQSALTELGYRLTQRRIALNLTQNELATRAGIGKRTLERMENGSSIQSEGLLRVLRELELLDELWKMIPRPGPSPMAMIKLQGKIRKRAAVPRGKDAPQAPLTAAETPPPWTWGDEK